LSIFIGLFAVLLALTAEIKFGQLFTTVAFIIGAITSILSGYIGMRIAVYTNVRTTKECATDIHKGFVVAYRGGQVLGFVLVGLALLVLQILIIVYKNMYLGRVED
jgi:H+-translocating diphosphatase